MTPFDRVLNALRSHHRVVTRQGSTSARAHCPAHDDKRPSLAVSYRDGRVGLYCHARCRTQDVVAALGLTFADLRAESVPLTREPQRVVAVYRYCDLDGTEMCRKLRLGPNKAFRWQRPTRTGTHASGLRGIKPHLYAREHTVDRRQIWITEGEKSADLLRRSGFVAVCPPGGAGQWRVEWTEAVWRAGAVEVVILADADRPGRLHAVEVARSCHDWRPSLPEVAPDDPWPEVRLAADDPEAEPLTVKLIELPGLSSGQDVHDWLTVHEHTVNDLVDEVTRAPHWHPSDPTERKRTLNADRQRRWRERQRMARNAVQDRHA